MAYMFTFFTHSGAIKFDRRMKKNNISSELMPVPRTLSSGCGFCSKVEYESSYEDLLDQEVEKVYKYDKNYYLLMFQNK